MKITKISVRKLFGIFDHDIPLSPGGITIVIGENGLGKTVILEATSAFFGENFLFFRDLEFGQITFHFEGDEIWDVTKTQSDEKLVIYVARRFAGKSVKAKAEKIVEIEIGQKDPEARRRRNLLHAQMLHYSDATRSFPDTRMLDYLRAKEWALHSPDIFEEEIFRTHLARSKEIKPAWFISTTKKISIRLIETQRIITAKERGGESYVNRVNKSAKELAETISEIDKVASQTATELDGTYPNRLVLRLRQKANEPS